MERVATRNAAVQTAATPADKPSMLSRKLKALVTAAIQVIERMIDATGPKKVNARISSFNKTSAVITESWTKSLKYGPNALRSSHSPSKCITKAAPIISSATAVRFSRTPDQYAANGDPWPDDWERSGSFGGWPRCTHARPIRTGRLNPRKIATPPPSGFGLE